VRLLGLHLIIERFRTQTTVLSQSEIHPRARLTRVGGISRQPSEPGWSGAQSGIRALHTFPASVAEIGLDIHRIRVTLMRLYKLDRRLDGTTQHSG
jgi:hypothetical protein